jgi:hypothetical protein
VSSVVRSIAFKRYDVRGSSFRVGTTRLIECLPNENLYVAPVQGLPQRLADLSRDPVGPTVSLTL